MLGPEDFCSKSAGTIIRRDLTDRNSRLSFTEANSLFAVYCGIIGCKERLERFSAACLDVSMIDHFIVCIYQVIIPLVDIRCTIRNNPY